MLGHPADIGSLREATDKGRSRACRSVSFSAQQTRRPRGSIGRSLNPLGALVPIGVGPGTQLRSEVVDGRSLRRAIAGEPRSEDRCDPVTALPVSREVRIRRSAGRPTARRSRKIPVRSPDHPEHSVSRCSGHPHCGDSSRHGFHRSVPTVRGASGSPLWRSGKVDHGHAHGKLKARFIFAICSPLFAGCSPGVCYRGSDEQMKH